MSLPRPALLRLPMAPLLAAAVVTAVVAPSGPASSPGAASLRVVRYDGVSVRVPASWPVFDLAKDPQRCVRLDVHAVYLGTPGPQQDCPAHLVGRSEALVIGPQPGDMSTAPVATRGELTRGMMVVDTRPQPAGPATARVATDVSVGEVRQYIDRILKAAP